MIEKILSPISREIWFMLDHPEDWVFDCPDKYNILHKETFIALWISDGRFFLDGYKTLFFLKDFEKWFETKSPSIGFFDRNILWFKVKNVIRRLESLESNNESLLKNLVEYNRSKNDNSK